jgi:diguanylate cyclase (GGDEF)-like protein/PAS domain S-box-containing protein
VAVPVLGVLAVVALWYFRGVNSPFALVALLLLMMVYILRYRSTMSEKLVAVHEQLQSVLNNAPGGIVQMLDDQELTLCFVSEGFLRLCGHDHGELRDLGNAYLRLVHPQDVESVRSAMRGRSAEGESFELECRLRRKSKTGAQETWLPVIQKGRRVSTGGHSYIYASVVDISETKRLAEENRISEVSLRRLLDISGSSLFDLRLQNGEIVFSQQFCEKFGWPETMRDFPRSILETGMIHEDDGPDFTGFLEKIHTEGGAAETEIRLLRNHDAFVWCAVAATVVCDQHGRVVKIVGKIEDIDQRKRAILDLTEQTRHDACTGLYNKPAASEMIAARLREARDTRSVLLVVDVDNFKSVNDILGHPVGDQAIKELSAELKRLFRLTDIIGRLGGDEFLVYMENVPSVGLCEAKARAICQAFRRSYGGPEATVEVSASVGIAVSPEHGTTYEDLYCKADQALYQAKHQGKDQYSLAVGFPKEFPRKGLSQ